MAFRRHQSPTHMMWSIVNSSINRWWSTRQVVEDEEAPVEVIGSPRSNNQDPITLKLSFLRGLLYACICVVRTCIHNTSVNGQWTRKNFRFWWFAPRRRSRLAEDPLGKDPLCDERANVGYCHVFSQTFFFRFTGEFSCTPSLPAVKHVEREDSFTIDHRGR